MNIIIASIAMEELAIAHILNAEGEKLQYVLGTLDGAKPEDITICDIMEVNKSMQKTLRDVTKAEMLLQFKLEDVLALAENEDACTMDITVKKIWADNNNAYATRPPTVDINLLRDGVFYRKATLDSMGTGTYTFACLPVWNNSQQEYKYEVTEATVPAGYTVAVDGYIITNTLKTVTIHGTKTWVDEDEATRPGTITVHLLQNGGAPRTQQVTSPTGGQSTSTFDFLDIPVFDAEGKPYAYTLTEDKVEDYDTEIKGFHITNTVTP